MDFTRSIWPVKTVNGKVIGHPAPFPVDLVRRCIELYSYRGDTVLDPFMGSGTTGVAAVVTGRKWVGYEVDPGYVDLALERIRRAGNPLLKTKVV